MHMEGTSAATRAVHVVRGLLAGGVTDVVLAPGSRSAPFALALYAADAAGNLRLHVRLDERSAGFLALGLSVGSRRPVAVVTTSGTAVGNLLPAVMEAHHSGRPIVVVSADRPAALRGTGANQTTWQAGIFGRFAPCADLAVDAPAEAVDAAVAVAVAGPGPAQLNVQLDAPLVPEPGVPWWPGAADHGTADDPVGWPEREVLPTRPRTVLVAGDDAGPAARILAERSGWPLLAEPTSGSRAGEHAIRCYRLLLGTPLGEAIERVVVVGHPTLSRPVSGLLARVDVELLAVRSERSGIATDPAGRARVLEALPQPDVAGPSAADQAWLQAWQAADARLSGGLDALVGRLPELDALQVAAEVGAALGPGQALVCGSSNPVRDLDLMLAPYPSGRRRLVVGNRGLAGIDGTVSTAIGVALARQAAPRPRTLALLGDLTLLHDSTGLLIGPDEPRPDLTLVVVNDDGGSIFALLEQGDQPYAAAFERVFATPTHADLAALAATSHTAYRLVSSRDELREALADDTPGLRLVEARVSRADRRATAARIAALAGELGVGGWPA